MFDESLKAHSTYKAKAPEKKSGMIFFGGRLLVKFKNCRQQSNAIVISYFTEAQLFTKYTPLFTISK